MTTSIPGVEVVCISADMAPNLEECVLDGSDPRSASSVVLFLSPLSNSEGYTIINNTQNDDGMSDDDDDDEDLFQLSRACLVPLEHNLRELLVRVTSTEDLVTVTQVKLRVIARDLPLQQLSIYVPALRELILDGSVVSTLRDLGCGLRNLKVLSVNRCSLTCLDGMSAFENLEELYAADNAIENVVSCAFLTSIKIIDLRRNLLKNISRTLGFLTLCENLEHIHLEGNDEIWQSDDYRQTVKSLLPALKTLDGITFGEEDDAGNVESCTTKLSKGAASANNNPQSIGANLDETTTTAEYHSRDHSKIGQTQLRTCDNSRESCQTYGFNSPRPQRLIPADAATCGYTVRFPPKVFLDRPSSSTSCFNSRTTANKEAQESQIDDGGK